MSLTQERVEQILRGMTTIAGKVYPHVSATQEVTSSQVYKEMSTKTEGFNINLQKLDWVLGQLSNVGLLRERGRGKFIRVAVRTAEPVLAKPVPKRIALVKPEPKFPTQFQEQLNKLLPPEPVKEEPAMTTPKVDRGPSGRKGILMLSLVQSAKLIGMIDKDYTASGLNDEAFAASVASHFPNVTLTAAHIFTRRKEMGVPSNTVRKLKPKVTSQDVQTIMEMLAAMEKRLVALEKLTGMNSQPAVAYRV